MSLLRKRPATLHSFHDLGTVNPDIERLMYGYDFLVIIPELKPAEMIR